MTTNRSAPHRPEGREARLARRSAERAAHRRAIEDQVLAEAERLGDAAPEIIRETALSIRDHREDEARRSAEAERRAAENRQREAAHDNSATRPGFPIDSLADVSEAMREALDQQEQHGNRDDLAVAEHATRILERNAETTAAGLRASAALERISEQLGSHDDDVQTPPPSPVTGRHDEQEAGR